MTCEYIKVVGGTPLVGEVAASGAKNACLPIIAASLLTDQDVVLSNVPNLADVKSLLEILKGIGVSVEWLSEGCLRINAKNIHTTQLLDDFVKTMRASVLMLGSLLARFGSARLSLPGGCTIGARPIDQHVKAFKMLGAEVDVGEFEIAATAKELSGQKVRFDVVTVTGTENLMMAACLANGVTVIENAACEPEIEDLANFLNKLGAKVNGAGTSVIRIDGVNRLGGAQYNVMGDRIEAGTYMCVAVATKGDITVNNISPNCVMPILKKIQETGAQTTYGENWVRVKMALTPVATDIVTEPHPGFPTDMQSQFMALSAVSVGVSHITETIFENRYMHVPELMKMGAKIKVSGQEAEVHGGTLQGATVYSTDLRAAAALIVAALAAEGETKIYNLQYLDRGYEKIEEKLTKLGAKIERVIEAC